MHSSPDGYDTWERSVADHERRDPLWKMESYRLARFAGNSVWVVAEALRKRPLGYPVADQLLRSVHSIAANLAEGYSRGSGRDRVRFFEYALGSTREAIVWYNAALPFLQADVTPNLTVLASIRGLLLTTIPGERSRGASWTTSR